MSRAKSTTVALVGVLLAGALLCVGCGGREAKAERLLGDARDEVREGRIERAIEIYDKLVDRYPGTAAARSATDEARLYRGLSNAVGSYAVRRVREQIVTTARAIQAHRRRNGRWPASLDALGPAFAGQERIDPWGRELIYRRKPDNRGYVLASYGEDGSPGGHGDRGDWYVEDGDFVRSPSIALPTSS